MAKVLLYLFILMPSANFIRKEILQALENYILPALWQQNVPLGCVTPRLLFPESIQTRLLSKTVPRNNNENLEYPLQNSWPRANLYAAFFPYFGFIYEGAADERTLITKEQSAKYHLSKGVYAIRWKAPSVLLFPSGTPRNSGSSSFWYSDDQDPNMKILWVNMGSEMQVRNGIIDAAGHRHSQHALQINDPSIIALAGLFIRELQNTDIEDQRPARAILLATMLCLQKKLHLNSAKIANTSYSQIPTFDLPSDEYTGKLCRDAAIYIEMHLHEALTLPGIASQVGISPVHLNRLFQRYCGSTVMHYVRTHRIAAAEGILEHGHENIAEIAQMVGFKRANVFCRSFREETGMSPRQYRHHSRRSKNTFLDAK